MHAITDTDDSLVPSGQPLEQLNTFLQSRGISPVRYPMKTDGKRPAKEQRVGTNGKRNKQTSWELKFFETLRLSTPSATTTITFANRYCNSKLSKFAIQMLRNICEHFDNPTADVIITKKAPYIERTVAFGKKCTYQGWSFLYMWWNFTVTSYVSHKNTLKRLNNLLMVGRGIEQIQEREIKKNKHSKRIQRNTLKTE